MSKTLSLKNMQAGTNLDDQRAIRAENVGVEAAAHPALRQSQSIQEMIAAAVAQALAAQAAPAPVIVPPEQSVEELRQMLERAEAKRANEESQKIVITPNPPDLRHLPPVGERSSVAVQAPPKVWGDPRWLRSG